MNRHTMLGALGCALVAIATFTALPAVAQEKKSNVVFILADNVGYGDLGPYGGGELRGAPTPLFGWTLGPLFEAVDKYKETLKTYPNPPAPNLTKF